MEKEFDSLPIISQENYSAEIRLKNKSIKKKIID